MSIYYAKQIFNKERTLINNPIYAMFPYVFATKGMFYTVIVNPRFFEDLVILKKFFGTYITNIEPNIIPAVKKRVRYMI